MLASFLLPTSWAYSLACLCRCQSWWLRRMESPVTDISSPSTEICPRTQATLPLSQQMHPPPAADGNGQSMLDVTVSLASDLSSPPPPSIVPVSAQAHASKISTASVLNSPEAQSNCNLRILVSSCFRFWGAVSSTIHVSDQFGLQLQPSTTWQWPASLCMDWWLIDLER